MVYDEKTKGLLVLNHLIRDQKIARKNIEIHNEEMIFENSFNVRFDLQKLL